MRMRWILPIALLLLAASAISGIAKPRFGRAAAPAKTITVTGTGTVTAVPDRASFGFTVETRGRTATSALAQNADSATAVIAAVKATGVAAASIQTSQVSLMPQSSQDGTSIVGYIASNTVTVQTDVARAGRLVDAAVTAGATGFSGPSLERTDQDALYRDALKKAVADAKLKAEALAGAAGVALGATQSVSEGQAVSPPVPIAAAKLDSGSVPIEPGTQETRAVVTVTYAAG